ncbi:amphi-Trp domain-containing protein [Halobium salinum]|uniref:Amphi-Trp domain-containing protein n=1 Tax=Halobium salinum TaxID=1364940 RepID=A0ABD5P9M7_9EURY|nr:amphi-Trp domain-containing protein [Halobium salinum]
MADSTEHSSKMNREEFAGYLRRLADEFEKEGDIDVPVGNKSVRLHPPDSVKRDIEVVERSSILRGSKEAIGLDVKWKKSKKSGTSKESNDADEAPDEERSGTDGDGAAAGE